MGLVSSEWPVPKSGVLRCFTGAKIVKVAGPEKRGEAEEPEWAEETEKPE